MSEIVPFQPRGLGPQRDPGPGRMPLAEGYPEAVGESAGIKEYLGIVRRQLWIVLSILAVCLGVTSYFVLRAAPRYMANTVVRLADSRRAMTGIGEAGAYDEVLGRETDVLLSQIQVLMSRQIVTDAVDREGLRLVPVVNQDYLPEITAVNVSDSAVTDTLRLTYAPDAASLRAGAETATAAYGEPLRAGGVTLTVTKRPPASSSAFVVVSRARAADNLLQNFKATPRPKTDIIDLQFT